MKLLDERGIGTVWSICKEKFALAGHTHNYAGSGSPGGSANSAIGVVDYGQTDKTIQIGYSGTGITGDQIKYIAGYTDGSGNVNAKIKDVSKDALRAWLGLGSLAYSSSSIPTNLSQLNNDKGFVTGSVSGNTVTINGTSTTWTNTWRGIQDNLTSSSTSDSLSANQGRILKGLVDSKANSNKAVNDLWITNHPNLNSFSLLNIYGEEIHNINLMAATSEVAGVMSAEDKAKLDSIAAGANNYTLPTASTTTLGGIKTGYNGTDDASKWAVKVDNNSNAYVPIQGLRHYNNNIVSGLNVSSSDNNLTTSYDAAAIAFASRFHGGYSCYFPTKGGTFALTSDLSDLCKFNFVNSISECNSDRINFFLRCPDSTIHLDPFDSYPDGTILLITITQEQAYIEHQSGIWYSLGNRMEKDNFYYTYDNEINLITKNNGTVHHYRI